MNITKKEFVEYVVKEWSLETREAKDIKTFRNAREALKFIKDENNEFLTLVIRVKKPEKRLAPSSESLK